MASCIPKRLGLGGNSLAGASAGVLMAEETGLTGRQLAHMPSLLASLPYVRQSNPKSARSAGRRRRQTTYTEASEARMETEGRISSLDTHSFTHSFTQPLFLGTVPTSKLLCQRHGHC